MATAKAQRKPTKAALTAFEKATGELLLEFFRTGRLEELFALIKAYSTEFSPNTFYRLAVVSKMHRKRAGGAALEWVNLIGQIVLSPQRQDGPNELSMGAFSHAAFKPCRACRGEGFDLATIGRADADVPDFLAHLEGDLGAALDEILEQGGLMKALLALRGPKGVRGAGPADSYQIDFRSEYITRDKSTERLSPRQIKVIRKIAFPLSGSGARKIAAALSPEPELQPARPCPDCGGAGFLDPGR